MYFTFRLWFLLYNYICFDYYNYIYTSSSLIVQLARDLQTDFYPHFPRVFTAICVVLKKRHHDSAALEQAFHTFAYIFKFLWRSMLADLPNVYELVITETLCWEECYVKIFVYVCRLKTPKCIVSFDNFILMLLSIIKLCNKWIQIFISISFKPLIFFLRTVINQKYI